MLRAAARGDLVNVQHLLRAHGPPMLSVHGSDGCTPLLIACKKGHLDVVDFLLSSGHCSVWDKDMDPKRQGNAIHYAAWGGHEDLVSYLVESRGVQLGDLDVVGNTPLLYAIYGGHMNVIQALLRRGRTLGERNNKNHTAILQAACGGHLDIVRWLLEQGFSIRETDNDGNTALLFAAWGGHKELMEYLLKHGSQLQEKNHNGHSVFLSAANGGRVGVVEWLLEKGFSIDETNNNGDTALLLAAYGGHRKLVQRLLPLGASLEDKNGCGFTPLLSAANGGQLEMARWLLERGSSLDESDNDGYTSLILAACGGSIELVKFFLQKGASLQERNNNGDTALLLSAYCGHKDLVEWLLANGSSLEERNNTGMGVLISAANGGHLSVIAFLLERLHGECLEDTDEGGYTPLLLAAQRGHLPVVQHLAAHGANIRARTSRHDNDAIALSVDTPEVQEYLRTIWDWRPLQVACDARLVDRVHEMLRAGVDPIHGYQSPSPLQICKATSEYPGASEPNDLLMQLMTQSCRRWSPITHSLHGAEQRAAVVTVLMLKRRLDHTEGMPTLPPEMWMHILSFMPRAAFQSASVKRDMVPPRPCEVGFRDVWRRRRILGEDIVEVVVTQTARAALARRLAGASYDLTPVESLESFSSEDEAMLEECVPRKGNEAQTGRVTPVVPFDGDSAFGEDDAADPKPSDQERRSQQQELPAPVAFLPCRVSWV